MLARVLQERGAGFLARVVLSFFFFKLSYVYKCFAYVCVCVSCMCMVGAHGGQKRLFDPLELGSQVGPGD